MSTRAALRVHDHLRRRHHPKADRRSVSHAGDERGNRPRTGAVLHQHGYGAVTRQTAACWDARSGVKRVGRGLNRVQLMRHPRTHHSRTSRNTHPRGCSGRLATVLPDDRLADMHHAVGDAFPPIIGEICLRRMVRASGNECGWTSCRSRRGNLGQRRWLGSWCASGAVADKARGDCLPRLQVDARSPLAGTTNPTTLIATSPFSRLPTSTGILHSRRHSHPLPPRSMDRPAV